MTWALPIVSTTVQIGTAGGGITANEPSGAQSGDLLVAVLSYRGGVQFTAPSGWDTREDQPGTGTSTGAGLAIYTIERAGAAPSLTWARTGGSSASVTVLAYRPSTAGAFAFVTSSSGGTSSSTSTHTVAGVTTTGASQLIVGAVTHASSGTDITSWDATDPGADSGSSVDATNAPSDGQWRLRKNYANGTGASHRQIVVDGQRASAGATGNLVYTSSGNTTVKLAAVVFAETGGGGGDTITLDEIDQYTVFEGAAGSTTVTISGTHTGATDDIEVQIEDLVSGVVVAWGTLDTAVVEGAFSGVVSVPIGGWYLARARKASETAITDIQASQWGVGIIVGGFGQSHLRDWVADGTGPSNNRAVVHDGAAFALLGTAGAGICTAADALVTALDCPVCFIVTGVGGTAISYWWSAGKTANYDAWEGKVTAAGGGLSAFMLWQGDANVGDSKASYKAEIDAVFAQLRTDYGSGLPVCIGELGRKGGGVSDANWEAIRDAHVDAGNDAGNHSWTTVDLEQGVDEQHFTDAGLSAAGERIAQCVLHALGDASYSRGPVLSSASYSGAVVTVTLTHGGGTDFAPTAGITGIGVLDNGTPATISSAVRGSATTIELTCSASLSGPVTVRAGYGAYPTVSGWIADNSALALPLQTTDLDVAATKAPQNVSVSLVDAASGASVLSASVMFAATLTDGAASADVLSASSAYAASLLDNASAADLVSAGATLAATLLDAATADDVRSALSTLAASLTDGAAGADLLAATLVASATVLDAVAAAESVSASNTAAASLVDGVAGADALQSAAVMVASLLDVATVAEQFTTAKQMAVLLTDAAASSDLRSGSVPVTYNVSLLDLAVAVDVLSGVIQQAVAKSAPPLGQRLSSGQRVNRLSLAARPSRTSSRTR